MQTYSIKDIELAVAAGFFNGEGTTSINNKANKVRTVPSLRVTVPQTSTNKEELYRFKAAVGVGLIHTCKKSNHRSGFQSQYSASNKDARLVIALIYPYLSLEKRKQADEAIAIRDAWEKLFRCGHPRDGKRQCMICKKSRVALRIVV
jgi:hypothetical protein